MNFSSFVSLWDWSEVEGPVQCARGRLCEPCQRIEKDSSQNGSLAHALVASIGKGGGWGRGWGERMEGVGRREVLYGEEVDKRGGGG